MRFKLFMERTLEIKRLVISRIRARCLKFRGADVADKVRIAERCSFLMPMQIKLGRRVEIESDVYLKLASSAAKCEIGDYVFIGKGVEINIHDELLIGAHSQIAPGVFIVDHNHQIDPNLRINQQPCTTKKVAIGEDVWIGTKSVILAGVKIGNGAVVGAGSVVTKNVDDLVIVAGVPAQIIGRR